MVITSTGIAIICTILRFSTSPPHNITALQFRLLRLRQNVFRQHAASIYGFVHQLVSESVSVSKKI